MEPTSRQPTATSAARSRPEPPFRPTIVVDTGAEPPFVEDVWTGRRMHIGTTVLRCGEPLPRCALIDHRSDGERDPALRALAADRMANGQIIFGLAADVEVPGAIGLGDSVAVRSALQSSSR